MYRPAALLVSLLALGACAAPGDLATGPSARVEDETAPAPRYPSPLDARTTALPAPVVPSVAPASAGPVPGTQPAAGRWESEPSVSEEVALGRRLATLRVSGFVVEEEESLREVAATLQTITGLPIVVHPAAEEAVFDAGVLFNLRLEYPLPAKSVLNLIAELAGDDVVWTVRHGVVLFTTRSRAGGGHVLVAHNVQALVAPRTEFLAPRIDRLRMADDYEDEDGGGPFGAVAGFTRAFEEDQVVSLITENVARDTWSDDGVSIEMIDGHLFVRHTPETQRAIRLFLARLGA